MRKTIERPATIVPLVEMREPNPADLPVTQANGQLVMLFDRLAERLDKVVQQAVEREVDRRMGEITAGQSEVVAELSRAANLNSVD